MARRKKIKNNSTLQVVLGIIVFILIVVMGNNHDLDLLESLKETTELDSLENVENVDNTTDEIISSVTGNLIIDYIDQTTPNMIQRISGIFERNPLISKEI